MDKAGSSIVAPATPGSAPTPKASGASAGGSATGGSAGSASAAASLAANWKLRVALILLIGVFVFATAYKLNKTKRAKAGSGKKAVAVTGASGGSAGATGAAVESSLGPIPLPGFPGAKPADKEEKK